MNEIIHSFEKVNQSNKIKENKNQNDFNNIKNDDELSPFIVRKTEIIGIYYFILGINEKSEEKKII